MSAAPTFEVRDAAMTGREFGVGNDRARAIRVDFDGGRSVVILPDRLRLAPNNGCCHVEILNEKGKRRGVYCAVSHPDADKLANLGIPVKDTAPKVKREPWRKGEFEIEHKRGRLQVWGWRRGGWGIPLHYMVDGDIEVDSQPETNLTQIKTGLAALWGTVGKMKRAANMLDDRCPDLATCDKLSDLPPEQLAAAKAIREEFST